MAKKGKTSANSKKVTKKVVVEEKTPLSKIVLKPTTIEKAVSALSQWNQKRNESSEKQNLLEEEDDELPLILQVSSTKFFSDNKVLHVEQLLLPNPIISDDIKVCVITKDGLITSDILDQIEEAELPHFNKVITVHDLKTTYKPYQSRRKLLSEFDVFLVDAMVVSLMPKLLGKIFYQSPKLPLTIKVASERKFDMELFKKSYSEALSSVGYILPMGNNMVIRIGVLGQEVSKLVENLNVISQFLNKFQIRALQLKLSDSPSLPIYSVDKIYTADDISKEEVDEKDLKKADAAKLQQEALDEEQIFQEGLKELGFEEEEEEEEADEEQKNKKRSADKVEEEEQAEEKKSKSVKKSKKN